MNAMAYVWKVIQWLGWNTKALLGFLLFVQTETFHPTTFVELCSKSRLHTTTRHKQRHLTAITEPTVSRCALPLRCMLIVPSLLTPILDFHARYISNMSAQDALRQVREGNQENNMLNPGPGGRRSTIRSLHRLLTRAGDGSPSQSESDSEGDIVIGPQNYNSGRQQRPLTWPLEPRDLPRQTPNLFANTSLATPTLPPRRRRTVPSTETDRLHRNQQRGEERRQDRNAALRVEERQRRNATRANGVFNQLRQHYTTLPALQAAFDAALLHYELSHAAEHAKF